MSAEIADIKEARAQRAEERESGPAENSAVSDTERAKPKAKEEEAAEPAPRPEELWHCRNEAWATLPNGWNHPVQSPEFRHWLVG